MLYQRGRKFIFHIWCLTLLRCHDYRNPQTTAQLLRMIASRVRDEVDNSPQGQNNKSRAELGHNNTNLKTVAILPSSRNVPVEAFARKLHAALEAIGASTSLLNQAVISNHLGKHAFTRMGKLKVGLIASIADGQHSNTHC